MTAKFALGMTNYHTVCFGQHCWGDPQNKEVTTAFLQKPILKLPEKEIPKSEISRHYIYNQKFHISHCLVLYDFFSLSFSRLFFLGIYLDPYLLIWEVLMMTVIVATRIILPQN